MIGRVAFPPGFTWGVGTSSYQIEGGVGEDGRGESIWDRFSHDGRVANGDTGDVTSDHYHRWAEDVELMARLGVGAYRFSIAWPRIQPEGSGRPNPAGIAFYDRLIDALLERGIQPAPTLYHWDLPQGLEDGGGWLGRNTVERFGEYAARCYEAFGDRVRTWFTINEPWVAATLGYRLGIHAPGYRDLRLAVTAGHHLLLAHGAAVRAFRDSGREGRIGIVLSLSPTYPATQTDADRAAAHGSDGYTNRWFLDPVLTGRYPADMLALFERLTGPLDPIRDGDAALIGEPSDLLGVNYYTRRVIAAGDSNDGGLPWIVRPAAPDTPKSDTGWEITPECLYDVLTRIRDDYGSIPILITENGSTFLDQPGPDGRTPDVGRIRFLRDHLRAAHRAIDAGVPVEGYFHWSLLDNFEWAEGFRTRFGLVHVDYPTGRRLPKDSFHAYARIIAANALEPADQPADTAGPADAPSAPHIEALLGERRRAADGPGAAS
jgi:beta-glucosidase